MRHPFLLLSVWLTACAAPGAERPDSLPAPASAGGAAPDSLVGTVRVVGSAPVNIRVVLQDGTRGTPLGGPLLPEIRRLSGAEVVARGRMEGGVLQVADYRIRSVDGQPVVQGTVVGRSGAYVQLRTAEGTLLYLVAPPEELRTGEKVWVQGPEALIVQTYGILRP